MNNQDHPLRRVSMKVLEDWATMLVDPADKETALFESSEPLFLSSVSVHGAFQGNINIVAQRSFLASLASNLLGDNNPSELGEEELKDAFREMGNVLAGNFLTEAYGDDVVFEVLNPTVSQIAPESFDAMTKSAQAYYFQADDTPVCVSFDLKTSAL